jgi:hypothetical protein
MVPAGHPDGSGFTQSPSRSRVVPGGQALGTSGIKGATGLAGRPVLHVLPSSATYRSLQHEPSGIFV